jgi:hypothetical protein
MPATAKTANREIFRIVDAVLEQKRAANSKVVEMVLSGAKRGPHFAGSGKWERNGSRVCCARFHATGFK